MIELQSVLWTSILLTLGLVKNVFQVSESFFIVFLLFFGIRNVRLESAFPVSHGLTDLELHVLGSHRVTLLNGLRENSRLLVGNHWAFSEIIGLWVRVVILFLGHENTLVLWAFEAENDVLSSNNDLLFNKSQDQGTDTHLHEEIVKVDQISTPQSLLYL